MPLTLSGFTLFKTSKGWQFSIREEGENGWLIRVDYPDEKAKQILNCVGNLMPDRIVIPLQSEQSKLLNSVNKEIPPWEDIPKPQVEQKQQVPTGKLELRPLRKRVIL